MGNASLLTESGINFTPPPMEGFTKAYVAADGQFIVPSPLQTASRPMRGVSIGFAAWG